MSSGGYIPDLEIKHYLYYYYNSQFMMWSPYTIDLSIQIRHCKIITNYTILFCLVRRGLTPAYSNNPLCCPRAFTHTHTHTNK